MNYKLFAPKQFWETDWEKYIVQCNGCGDDSVKEYSKTLGINMDCILCVNVRPACAIHDWQYSSPKTLGIKPSNEHRLECDRIFYDNLILIVDAEGIRLNSWKITTWARRRICSTYYFIVKKFGGKAYWDSNKTNDTNLELLASITPLEERLWIS